MNTLLSSVAALKPNLGEGSLAVGRVLHSVSSSTKVSVVSKFTHSSLRRIFPPVTSKTYYKMDSDYQYCHLYETEIFLPSLHCR